MASMDIGELAGCKAELAVLSAITWPELPAYAAATVCIPSGAQFKAVWYIYLIY
jgi:hypothetical protein